MIDAATRARWREMFRVATRGPWASEHRKDWSDVVSVPAGLMHVALKFHSMEDASLTASARDGWPRTLDELEATERRLDSARDENERTGAELREARRLLAQVIEERDAARSERDSAVMARRASDAEMSAVTKHQTAYAARAEALFTAMRRWKRDRFAPALLQAWEEFCKPCA